jgi:hypothetical protein
MDGDQVYAKSENVPFLSDAVYYCARGKKCKAFRQGHFILGLDDEFREFQASKMKIPDAWNAAFSQMHTME